MIGGSIYINEFTHVEWTAKNSGPSCSQSEGLVAYMCEARYRVNAAGITRDYRFRVNHLPDDGMLVLTSRVLHALYRLLERDGYNG